MKKAYKIGLISIIVFASTVWLYWGNESIQTTVYEVRSPKISEAVSGYTIVQVSDLHNKLFGARQATLMAKIKAVKPDIIVVTGDVVDSRKTNIDVAMTFFEEAVKLADVYYVPGNHEARVGEYPLLQRKMTEVGVNLIDNRQLNLNLNAKGETFTIAGVSDPMFSKTDVYNTEQSIMQRMLGDLQLSGKDFTILLSHRPEFMEMYAKSSADLVLSGHAHGGQIRLPLIGGVIAPNQGLFPTYTAGMFSKADTNMIVSRGLGNSIIPLRINNRPELVVVRLLAE